MKVPTPGARSVDEVATLLGIPPAPLIKTLIYDTEKGLVAVAFAATARSTRSSSATRSTCTRLAARDATRRCASDRRAPSASLGPIGLPKDVPLLVDRSADARFVACGANRRHGAHSSRRVTRDIKP